MSDHTPGPWVIAVTEWDGQHNIKVIASEASCDHIAEVIDDADARLITAAPELLTAAILIVDAAVTDADDDWERALGITRGAIAKARGETA